MFVLFYIPSVFFIHFLECSFHYLKAQTLPQKDELIYGFIVRNTVLLNSSKKATCMGSFHLWQAYRIKDFQMKQLKSIKITKKNPTKNQKVGSFEH